MLFEKYVAAENQMKAVKEFLRSNKEAQYNPFSPAVVATGQEDYEVILQDSGRGGITPETRDEILDGVTDITGSRPRVVPQVMPA